jgi:hypothetical protein
MGGKELAIDHVIQPKDFVSGSCFGRAASPALPNSITSSSFALSKQFVPPQRNVNLPDSAHKASRTVIPLQPVNLVSESDSNSAKKVLHQARVEDSHWTACW